MGVVNGEVVLPSHAQPVEPTTPISPTSPGGYHFAAPPLSAGLKTPATAKTMGMSKEEELVVDLEEKAQKEDQKDLKIKLRVRLAKVVLRSVACACSLVVLSLVASTFAIFFATRHLATRNGLPPWAVNTPQWPQITILCIACVSLLLSLAIMYGYWKGGHGRAEKIALRATIFAVGVFIFTIVIWAMAIAVMQGSRASANGADMWGWACKDNQRRKLFQDTINFELVCRQQDWVVVCAIIEISLEFLAICVYLFAFYRIFYSKRRLRKSLHVRDEARASLWLAKLKEQQDLEAGTGHETETDKNTAYNQLNGTPTYYASEPEKGHAVPKLMPAPRDRGQTTKRMSAAGISPPLTPPPAMAAHIRDSLQDMPQSARSVGFATGPNPPSYATRFKEDNADLPKSARSVSFSAQPATIAGNVRDSVLPSARSVTFPSSALKPSSAGSNR